MFTVKGEHYYNDYTRSNFETTFISLEDIFQWLKKTSGNFNGEYGNYFPSVREVGGKIDVGRISVQDDSSRGWQYWIHEISIPNGIVFADGRTTNWHKFCAAKIEKWLKESAQRMNDIQNKPNFIEM